MSDSQVFLYINGLAGKVPVIDAFFKGFSNDYFAIISCCLILIWIWFGTNAEHRETYQRAVLVAVVSIGVTSLLMLVVNHFYFRPRPFNALPPGSVHMLFYPPTDSSFPSNLAAVVFGTAVPVFIKIKSYGSILLAIAAVASFGRVFMGVHYPLDVIGGAAIGSLGAVIAWAVNRPLSPVMDFVMDRLHRFYLA
jgi:undecaprenyl-diphosphatase